MNILVIGNGFDLAHGLPTSYSVFLNCPGYVGENWIDFESEIARVIRSLDNARNLTMSMRRIAESLC